MENHTEITEKGRECVFNTTACIVTKININWNIYITKSKVGHSLFIFKINLNFKTLVALREQQQIPFQLSMHQTTTTNNDDEDNNSLIIIPERY